MMRASGTVVLEKGDCRATRAVVGILAQARRMGEVGFSRCWRWRFWLAAATVVWLKRTQARVPVLLRGDRGLGSRSFPGRGRNSRGA